MTVRMLESCSDTDIAARVTVHEEDLDLTNGAVEDLGCRRVINGFVAGHDGVVG